jgi:hypothetical protein
MAVDRAAAWAHIADITPASAKGHNQSFAAIYSLKKIDRYAEKEKKTPGTLASNSLEGFLFLFVLQGPDADASALATALISTNMSGCGRARTTTVVRVGGLLLLLSLASEKCCA